MRPAARWIWPAALASLCIAAALGGDRARAALRWQHDALVSEPWRAFTAHLVHLDASHLAFNLAGLAVLWLLVGDRLRAHAWTLVAAWTAAVISLGLLATGLHWYVGLSGVLHGLLAAGAVPLWRTWRAGSAMLLGFLLVKGIAESVGLTTGDDVVVEAHWLGTGAGVVAGVLFAFFGRRTA